MVSLTSPPNIRSTMNSSPTHPTPDYRSRRKAEGAILSTSAVRITLIAESKKVIAKGENCTQNILTDVNIPQYINKQNQISTNQPQTKSVLKSTVSNIINNGGSSLVV